MNTLVFVDLPVSDTDAAHKFYESLFGWQINPRHDGDFRQIVPGEGLHLGLFSDTTQIPDPRRRRLSSVKACSRARTSSSTTRLRCTSTRRSSSAPSSCGTNAGGKSSTAGTPRSWTRGATKS